MGIKTMLIKYILCDINCCIPKQTKLLEDQKIHLFSEMNKVNKLYLEVTKIKLLLIINYL